MYQLETSRQQRLSRAVLEAPPSHSSLRVPWPGPFTSRRQNRSKPEWSSAQTRGSRLVGYRIKYFRSSSHSHYQRPLTSGGIPSLKHRRCGLCIEPPSGPANFFFLFFAARLLPRREKQKKDN